MLTLHYAPNTISVVVAIALHETGLNFDAKRVDFSTAEQTKPPYLALNPKGRVPTLVADQKLLTETGAILDFIADLSGALRPADPFAAAKMREVTYYLASTMHVNHAHKMRGNRWADQVGALADMTAKVPQTMAASAAYLEGALAFTPFALGSDMTLADPYLFVLLNWLAGDGVAIADYPKLAAFHAMMDARDSVQAVRAAGMLT